MTETELTILSYEGPILRAYLAMLRRAGVSIRRIVHMVQPRHPETGNAVGRWMPSAFRTPYVERLQYGWRHYWPRQLHRKHPRLVQAFTSGLAEHMDLDPSVFQEMTEPADLSRYGDRVEIILVKDISDPKVSDHLSDPETRNVIFTGGGIVPSTLLANSGCRLFHVHPGLLPDIRGADGLLWSTLLRCRPAASLLIMDSGIDTGDLVETREFEPFVLPLSKRDRPDDDTLYRMVFSFFDPVIRAKLLVDVARRTERFSNLASDPQAPDLGLTYHFMSKRLRHLALQAIFPVSG